MSKLERVIYHDRGSLFLVFNLLRFVLCSFNTNDLGPEGGKAIAEALTVNETVQNIKSQASFFFVFFLKSEFWLLA
jgi:hypothetical protein